MSETVQQPGSAPAPAEEYRPSESLSSEPDAAPEQPQTQSTPPPAEAAQEPEAPESEADKWKREKRSLDQRLGYLSKQRYAERHRAEEAERRLAEIQAQSGQQQQVPQEWWSHPDVQRAVDARAAELAKVQSFLNAGSAEVPDWDKKRFELIEMGADGQIAQLLVEMPQGHRVAAALYDNPGELERIADLKTERARAIALGRFAASLDARRSPTPSPQTPRRAPSSSLPPPITPPGPTRHGEPNPGGSMDDYYAWSKKQNWTNR